MIRLFFIIFLLNNPRYPHYPQKCPQLETAHGYWISSSLFPISFKKWSCYNFNCSRECEWKKAWFTSDVGSDSNM